MKKFAVNEALDAK
jgi:hypothetical protein